MIDNTPRATLLAAPNARELRDAEARRLLDNASTENLPVLACMFCGLTVAELIALRAADLDLDLVAKTLSTPDEARRRMPRWAAAAAVAAGGGAAPPPEKPLFAHSSGQRWTLA